MKSDSKHFLNISELALQVINRSSTLNINDDIVEAGHRFSRVYSLKDLKMYLTISAFLKFRISVLDDQAHKFHCQD